MNPIRTLFLAHRELPRVLPLLRDSRVPTWSKMALGAAAVFVISPLNLFGDIPLLGFADDATMLLLVAHAFVGFAEHRTQHLVGNS